MTESKPVPPPGREREFQIVDELAKITKLDLLAFVHERIGENPGCPVCKRGTLNVSTYLDGRPGLSIIPTVEPGLLLQPLTLGTGGPSTPCYTLICNNCGAVQLLSAMLIGDWSLGKLSTGEDNDG